MRIHEVRLENASNKLNEVVAVACQADGLLTEVTRPNLGGKCSSKLAYRALEQKGPYWREDCLGHADRWFVGDVEETDEHEQVAHDGHTSSVDLATTDARHEDEPVDQRANKG